jgi:hypothetical protein
MSAPFIRTDDPVDDQRTITLAGDQILWLQTVASDLEDRAPHDEDPDAVYEAARELRAIVAAWRAAPEAPPTRR